MERNQKSHLPFLLLALLCVGAEQRCPSNPNITHTDLSCDSDFNHTITCVWNSTSVSEQPDNVCTLNAKRESSNTNYNSTCKLEQVDVSRPTLRKCSLIFNRKYRFLSYHDLSMSLSCNPGKQTLDVLYRPACHIKLNPPPQPRINFTTASWEIPKHNMIKEYSCQLQWKHQDHLWRIYIYPLYLAKEQTQPSHCGGKTDANTCTLPIGRGRPPEAKIGVEDPSGQENHILLQHCQSGCTVELDPDQLIQGDRYEARLRIKAIGQSINSTWSDWSPIASWESPIGRIKQPSSGKGFAGGSVVIIAGAAAFAVFLVVSFFKTNKTTWFYMVKRMKPKPIPDPKYSFLQDGNFQNWLSPHFANESFLSPFKLVEIVSVEVASSVDAVSPCGPEAAMLKKMRSESSHQSTSSNFSNPSYSQLCSPPPPPLPVSSLTAGNLAPCNSDTPYGPVGGQAEDKNAEQDEEVKEEEIRQLLSKSSNSSELMSVISDYEKVEKLPVVCVRLQSLDSGVSSGEEVSQESLEADSINVTDEGEEEMAAGGDIQKLFGGSGGSIQVCSGYERVQKLQTDSPELLSQDSGIGGVGEEQGSQEESPEDAEKSTESSSLLFTPLPPSSPSPCFLPCFTTQPLKFSEPHVSPALHPLPSHLLERIALMSTNRSVEPSGDGYMPVRQDQS